MYKDVKLLIQNKTKVISLEYGVGFIIGNFSMYDGIDDYLKVEYLIDGKSRYFCMKNSNDVRLVSPKEMIASALILMNEKINNASILNNFSELSARFRDKDVDFIASRIVDLVRRECLSDEDSELLELTIKSLIYEVEEAYDVDSRRAQVIVNDFLKVS